MKNVNSTCGLLIIIASLLIAGATAETQWFENFCRGNKNTTKLHFYVHDVRTGPNATLYTVANASITTTSPTGFGRINVFDDRVTAAPDIGSEEVARAQGTTTSVDLQVSAASMNLNFYLTSGKFNGSTVTIIGRNQFTLAQRELPVAGGSGAFRYARGYAITSSYSNDATTNYSVLEYTIYITTSTKC
ncbi:dirigent protein 21-like [Salvia miltiorrhiza]|uniref:dirigent protein 21-like n=1 Tax=Salvia miltiorrhiza TaxID=226208 RepID=UPI0025AC41E4|nr:dirigent protein 21-like [Salvia miltiorrhiza]